MTAHLFRVLCPDGCVADDFDDLAAAARYAIDCDELHDGAVCVGAHVVVQATEWTVIDPAFVLTDLGRAELEAVR